MRKQDFSVDDSDQNGELPGGPRSTDLGKSNLTPLASDLI